jgi:hypothetical protein
MPLARITLRVPTLVGYLVPSGFRIVKVHRLGDGSYEVTLEPPGFPSANS